MVLFLGKPTRRQLVLCVATYLSLFSIELRGSKTRLLPRSILISGIDVWAGGIMERGQKLRRDQERVLFSQRVER